MSSGYFEAWVNTLAYKPTQAERALVEQITQEARATLGAANVQWGGSVSKKTAIQGSDMDLLVATNAEVTPSQRRALAARLQASLGRPAAVKAHAIRLHGQPDVDISFKASTFGARGEPDKDDFKDKPHRQQAARALKRWARSAPLPPLKGWVAEALVVALDQQSERIDGLALFRKVLAWFDRNGANPAAVEAILRPVAQSGWPQQWSEQLPGNLEAFSNHARRLLRRDLIARPLASAQDVEAWISNQP